MIDPVRIAVQSAQGNLQRAAKRLGATNRALQMRRGHAAGLRDYPETHFFKMASERPVLRFLRKPCLDEAAKIIRDNIHFLRSGLHDGLKQGQLGLRQFVQYFTFIHNTGYKHSDEAYDSVPTGQVNLWRLLLRQCQYRFAGIIR